MLKTQFMEVTSTKNFQIFTEHKQESKFSSFVLWFCH